MDFPHLFSFPHFLSFLPFLFFFSPLFSFSPFLSFFFLPPNCFFFFFCSHKRKLPLTFLFAMCHVSNGYMHYVENATPRGSHAMCPPLRLSCGIHMVMPCGTTPCVIRHSYLEIHEILTVSESNEIRLGN